MTEYLKFVKRMRGGNFICTMTGQPCPVLKDKHSIKNLEWEGCAASCDRPVEKAMEDRAEWSCRGDYPEW